MLSTEKMQNSALAASLVDWWNLAGVDYLVEEEPVNWMSDIVSPSAKIVTQPASVQAERMPLPVTPIETQKPAATAYVDSSEWPEDFGALRQSTADGRPFPGNHYGGKAALPVGEAKAPLMIIGDLPDSAEIDAGYFGAGQSGQLLGNMMRAAGFDLAQCQITALATTRPAIGEIPEEDLASLAAFALHQIAVADPQQILILGSTACRALLGKDLMEARISLPDVNHIVGKKAVLSTFHPRTLLSRPLLKAQAWQDLQMIAKKDAL